MSQTITPTARPPAPPTHSPPRSASDVLMGLIVAILAPVFLTVTAGDIGLARMAALETVNSYRIRNNADLIAVALIVAYGLAALSSLSLSMASDLSLSMTLRLRGNANACSRSAERNRRALCQGDDGQAAPAPAPPSAEEAAQEKADMLRDVAEAELMVAQTRAVLNQAHQATAQEALTAIVVDSAGNPVAVSDILAAVRAAGLASLAAATPDIAGPAAASPAPADTPMAISEQQRMWVAAMVEEAVAALESADPQPMGDAPAMPKPAVPLEHRGAAQA